MNDVNNKNPKFLYKFISFFTISVSFKSSLSLYLSHTYTHTHTPSSSSLLSQPPLPLHRHIMALAYLNVFEPPEIPEGRRAQLAELCADDEGKPIWQVIEGESLEDRVARYRVYVSLFLRMHFEGHNPAGIPFAIPDDNWGGKSLTVSAMVIEGRRLKVEDPDKFEQNMGAAFYFI